MRSGYKHIDTARVYGNEAPVGKAINDYLKESGAKRSDIFVTTKLWCTENRKAEEALRKSLERLQLDYVDLYLIHWPVAMAEGDELMPTKADGTRAILPFNEWTYVDTYKSMQKLLPLGLTKAIGISNFNQEKIEYLLNDPEVTVMPACNQIELHPYLPQIDLVEYCKSKEIVCEGYSPLGSTGAPLLQEPVLTQLAEKYSVSPACIAISWAVCRGTVVLPKSVNPSRVESNLKIVQLSSDDIEIVNDIHKTTSKRIVDPNWGIEVFGTDPTY